MLLTLLTTPSLKNFSSPAAVRPPIYHGPLGWAASRKPSDALSDPRRLLEGDDGMGMGLFCPGREENDTWAATLDVWRAGWEYEGLGEVDVARDWDEEARERDCCCEEEDLLAEDWAVDSWAAVDG